MDLFALDERALEWSGDIIAHVRPDQLGAPTPCGDWTLRELLGHMIAHNRGFAAAANGTPVGGEVWDRLDIQGDFISEYAISAADVTAAFSGELPERVEVYGFGTFGVRSALRMHIVDFVVHGWDVARSIGLSRNPQDDLAAAAYEIMQGLPSRRPNKAFGLIIDVPETAPITDRLMAHLGRSPTWPTPLPTPTPDRKPDL